MLQLAFTFASIMMLTSCALIEQQQYSKQTLAAVNRSEQKINDQLLLIDNRVSAQTQLQQTQIESLQVTLKRIESTVGAIKNQPAVVVSASASNPVESSRLVVDENSASSSVISTVIPPAEPLLRADVVTLGAVEKVYIEAIKSHFIARVDTGAATSSINAIDMQKFERNGKKWVKFHVSDDETAMQDRQWIESRIIRHVKIRQANVSGLERRPVIELWVKIGRIHEKAQFTLTDRTQMDYPLLLGREFIQDVALVDVSKDFIASKAPKKYNKKIETDSTVAD